ncbi:MAG: hypothetical protein IBX55_10475 [Methyloprofundus sp.]|nr:hypothetical protein [Methyloprofundus sp.]
MDLSPDKSSREFNSLPPIPGLEAEAIPSSNSKTQSKRRKGVLILSFALVGLAAVGTGGYFVSQAIQSELAKTPGNAVEFGEVVNSANAIPATPPSTPRPVEQAPSRNEFHDSAFQEPPSDAGLLSASAQDQATSNTSMNIETEPLLVKLLVSIEQTEGKMDSLAQAVDERLGAVDRRLEMLSSKVSGQDTDTQQLQRELSKIKSDIAKLRQATNARKETPTPERTHLQPNQSESEKSNTPQPPRILSFAVWQGRDAVMVETEEGRIRLIYVGDTLEDWRVQSIVNHRVVWKSLTDQSEVSVNMGEL